MKKNQFFIMVAVLGMIVLFALNTYAAETWHTATVLWAGPSGDNIRIKLQDTPTSVTYTCLATKFKNQMLAVALCAMINNMNVRAKFDDSKSTPTLSTLRLLAD